MLRCDFVLQKLYKTDYSHGGYLILLCFSIQTFHKMCIWHDKNYAPGEDRTLDLQIALYML